MKILARWLFLSVVGLSAISFAGSGPGVPNTPSRGNFLRIPQYKTTAALNLFLDPAGSDSNPCTAAGAASACLTPQHVEDLIPKLVRHPVTVTATAGNYVGLTTYGHQFDPVNVANGAFIQWNGTLITATIATGSATGTATSGSIGSGATYGTIVNSGEAWTVDNLKGFLIVTTGGTGSGQTRLIVNNTATTITIAGAWSVAPAAGTTYTISDWGTVFATAVNQPATQTNAASTPTTLRVSSNGFIRPGSASATTQATGAIQFNSISFAPNSAGLTAARIDGPAQTAFSRCRIKANTTNFGLFVSIGTQTLIGDTYITSDGTTGLGGPSSFVVAAALNVADSMIEARVGGQIALQGAFTGTIAGTRLGTASGNCANVGGGAGAGNNAPAVFALNNVQCTCSSTSCTPFALTGNQATLSTVAFNGVTIASGGSADALILVSGNNQAVLVSTSNVFTGSTAPCGLSALKGGSIFITANPTISGATNDLCLETQTGVTSSLAAFLALVPTAMESMGYGSRIYK